MQGNGLGKTVVLNTDYDMDEEDLAWLNTAPEDLWCLDKLILARYLGYTCGPVGTPVPQEGYYMVRPCVNAMGLGLGAQKHYIKDSTNHLTPGHFWCEWFEGDHISVDYDWGKQCLAVQGFKAPGTFTRWDRWIRVDDVKIKMPAFLGSIRVKYSKINCEYIGGKLIEVHLRHNPDFPGNRQEYIPVWQGQNECPPQGYEYIEDPDIHGRIGAWVK
jgi:hypothetical protein